VQPVEALMSERATLWYEQWRQEGKAEGLREGLEQGRRQGEAELLMRQLRRKFGSVPRKIQTRLRNAQPEQLLDWGERLLTANSLEEVFQ
jgi:flagellar biosynthesis/type III secretory pathway protein FliH